MLNLKKKLGIHRLYVDTFFSFIIFSCHLTKLLHLLFFQSGVLFFFFFFDNGCNHVFSGLLEDTLIRNSRRSSPMLSKSRFLMWQDKREKIYHSTQSEALYLRPCEVTSVQTAGLLKIF